jgi:hypothetical protein
VLLGGHRKVGSKSGELKVFICPRDAPPHRKVGTGGRKRQIQAGVVIGGPGSSLGGLIGTVGACDSKARYLGRSLL